MASAWAGSRSRVTAAVSGVRLDDAIAGAGSVTTGSSPRLADPNWAHDPHEPAADPEEAHLQLIDETAPAA